MTLKQNNDVPITSINNGTMKLLILIQIQMLQITQKKKKIILIKMLLLDWTTAG